MTDSILDSAKNLQSNEQHGQINEMRPQAQDLQIIIVDQQTRYISFCKILVMISILSLGNFYFGYILVYLNTLNFLTIVSIFNITMDTNWALALLVGIIPMGGIFGAISSVFIIKTFSRKWTLLIINSIALTLGGLIYIQNFALLMIVRFGQGFCASVYGTIGPIIIFQIAPTELSGRFGFLSQFMLCFGIFFAFFFKYIISLIAQDQDGNLIWKYVFGFPIIIITLQTFFLIFVYNSQTPRYLIQKNRFDQAKQLIRKLYKPEYVENVFRQKMIEFNKTQQLQNVNTGASVVLNAGLDSLQQLNNNNNLKKTPKVAIFLALHFGLLQQFAGINAVTVYGTQNVAKVFPSLTYVIPVILNFLSVVASLFLTFLLAKVGRRPIMQIGCLINILATVLIALGFSVLTTSPQSATGIVLTGMVIFMINFPLTIGPVAWIFTAETVPPKIVSYSNIMTWIGATIVLFLFPILTSKVFNNNPAPLFYFFAAWSLLALIINQKFMIQTKDKTQNQILQEFLKSSQKKTNDNNN